MADDQNGGKTFDASEISLAPPPQKGGAAAAPASSGKTFDVSEVSVAPPVAAPPQGFDESHPYLAKALDWANTNIAQPVIRVAQGVNENLRDIPKVFTDRQSADEMRTPFSQDTSTNPDVQDLSTLARRGGRLASDLLGVAASPFSTATAPIAPSIQAATTLPPSGNPDVDAVVNPAIQMMLLHGLSEGSGKAPAPLETKLGNQVTADRTRAAAPATQYEMDKQAEPVNRGLALPAGQYEMPESSLAKEQRQQAIDAGQKRISDTLANAHAKAGTADLEQKVNDLQKEVRQQNQTISRRAAIDEQLASSAAKKRGEIPTIDNRAVQPSPDELQLPNRSQETPQPPATSSARAGLVPPTDPALSPERDRPALVENKPVDENVKEPPAKSTAPAGLVTPIPPPPGGATAEDILSQRGAAGVRGQYQQAPMFGADEEKSVAQDAAEKAGARFVGEKNGLAELKLPAEMTKNLPINDLFKDHVSITLPTKDITPEKISAAMDRKVEEMGGKAAPNEQVPSTTETQPKGSELHSTLGANNFLNPNVWRAAFPTVFNKLDSFLAKGGTEEDLTSGIKSKIALREAMGTANRNAAIARESLADYRDGVNKWKPSEKIDFIRNAQKGKQQATPEATQLAKQIDDLFQKERDGIEKLGAGSFDHWRQNYFPQMSKEPGKVKSMMAEMLAKKPLEGTRAFTKARVFDDIDEVLKSGRQLVTDNPIDMALMKINEMQKYRMAHEALTEDMKNGNAIHVPYGSKRPAYASGWTKIDDRIGTTNKSGEITTSGNFYAPPDAAKIYNNYLSPGLKGNKYYDAVRGFGNVMNQAQLGLSAFHATTTAFNAITSDMALALEHGAGALKETTKGNLGEAAREVGRGAAAAGRAATGVGSIVDTAVRGYKANREYKAPGSYPNFADTAKSMERANATPNLHEIYQTKHIEALQDALNDPNIIRGGAKYFVHSVPALLQAASIPIMNHIVPTLKSGAFDHLSRVTLDRAQKEGWTDQRTSRELQKVQNSIDSRFGQVNPDNVFVNRMAKDIAYIAVRSTGWTGGTFAELGGGVMDAARQAGRVATGKAPQFSHRLAYTAALPITAAIYGGLLHYAFTGKAPDKLKDYFIVPDGKGNYFNLPTYMKDVLNISNDPIRTLASKAHPLGQEVTDLIRNENYQGVEIRKPDDPVAKQAYDSAKYLLKDSIPFSIQNAMKIEKQEGKLAPKDALGYVGVTPAPKWQTMGPAEKEMHDYQQRYGGQGVRTEETFEHQDLVHNLRQGLDNGTKSWDDVLEQLDSGKLSRREVKSLYKERDLTPIQRSFEHITDLNEAVRIWNKADDDEKKELEPFMRKKYRTLSSRSEDEQDTVAPKFQNFLDYEQQQ